MQTHRKLYQKGARALASSLQIALCRPTRWSAGEFQGRLLHHIRIQHPVLLQVVGDRVLRQQRRFQ